MFLHHDVKSLLKLIERVRARIGAEADADIGQGKEIVLLYFMLLINFLITKQEIRFRH